MSGDRSFPGSPKAQIHPFSDQLDFLRGLIARPKNVGAIAPSSPALAAAIAAQIDLDIPGKVLELGPGTGVVTEAIIARGIAPERLITIEYDPQFARLMVQRFPAARVICGDGFDLDGLLNAEFPAPFCAVVSGLPLLNQPMARRIALIEGALNRLAPGGPLIQFSYGVQPPVRGTAKVPVTLGAFVWRNLPPARVWVYHKA